MPNQNSCLGHVEFATVSNMSRLSSKLHVVQNFLAKVPEPS